MFLRLLVVLSLVLSATGLGILALQLLQPPGQPQQVARVEAPPAVAPPGWLGGTSRSSRSTGAR